MRWNFISDLSYRYLPQRYSSRAIHMSLPKRISYKYQLKWIGKLHLEMISLVKNTEGHRITLGIARVCASRPNSGHIDNEHRDGRVTNYLRLETYCDMVGGLYYLHTRLCIEANNFGNYRWVSNALMGGWQYACVSEENNCNNMVPMLIIDDVCDWNDSELTLLKALEHLSMEN